MVRNLAIGFLVVVWACLTFWFYMAATGQLQAPPYCAPCSCFPCWRCGECPALSEQLSKE